MEFGSYLNTVKSGQSDREGKNQTYMKTGCDPNRRREPYASNIVKYNVLTFYHPPRTGK